MPLKFSDRHFVLSDSLSVCALMLRAVNDHYATENDLLVVREYIDRVQSAKTDRRPEFLHMIADSDWGNFEVILVYQLDRFARSMNDSGYYRKILAGNGVRVVSAIENIATDSSGVMTEGMLITMGQWFSAQLSEKVTRGMLQRAEQCKFNGGHIPFGYAIDSDQHYKLDEKTAPIVKEIFERVSEGETLKKTMDDLNDRGIKTALCKEFHRGSLQRMLRNEIYKGVYSYADIRIPDALPRIISNELYDEVQRLMDDRRHGHRPAIEDYILNGKLYCGHCNELMDGVSGTSSTGKTYRYYKCTTKNCDKKNTRKELIEEPVLDTCREFLCDEAIAAIVKGIEEQNKKDQESTAIINIREEIKQTEKKIDVLLDQLETGENSSKIAERIRKREAELEELKRQLQKEQAKQKTIDPAIARNFLISIRDGSIDDIEYQKLLINTLVDRIYLYDDHFRIQLTNSGNKGKTINRGSHQIERYFATSSSTTRNIGAPDRLYPNYYFYRGGFATEVWF